MGLKENDIKDLGDGLEFGEETVPEAVGGCGNSQYGDCTTYCKVNCQNNEGCGGCQKGCQSSTCQYTCEYSCEGCQKCEACQSACEKSTQCGSCEDGCLRCEYCQRCESC